MEDNNVVKGNTSKLKVPKRYLLKVNGEVSNNTVFEVLQFLQLSIDEYTFEKLSDESRKHFERINP